MVYNHLFLVQKILTIDITLLCWLTFGEWRIPSCCLMWRNREMGLDGAWNVLTEASLVSRSDKILLTVTYISGISPEVVSLMFFIIFIAWFWGWVGKSMCHCPHITVGRQLLEVAFLLLFIKNYWGIKPKWSGLVAGTFTHWAISLAGLWRCSLLKKKISAHHICVLCGVLADYTNPLVVRGNMYLNKLFSYIESCILKIPLYNFNFHYII